RNSDDEGANQFLRESYIGEFNRRFTGAAEKRGSAFVRLRRKDLDWGFSVQRERVADRDNKVVLENRIFQIEKTRWRDTLAGCTVKVHEMLDGTVAIRFGLHEIARFGPGQVVAERSRKKGNARPLGYGKKVGEVVLAADRLGTG